MDLALCSLASGSSGNCYLLKSNRAAILIDAGISGKQIGLRLSELGLSVSDLNGVFITHEHSDHTQGIAVLVKTEGVRIYLNEKTLEGIGNEKIKPFSTCFCTGDEFEIEDIRIKTFHLSHDAADPAGFSFESGGKRVSVVTDTGVVTEEIYESVKDSDILVLESNHDVNILRMGRYPWFLKQRILSDKGHLSNDAAGDFLKRIILESREKGENKPRQILLAHLSKENNFPEMALATVNNILVAEGADPGRDVKIATLHRDVASPLYTV